MALFDSVLCTYHFTSGFSICKIPNLCHLVQNTKPLRLGDIVSNIKYNRKRGVHLVTGCALLERRWGDIYNIT